MSENKEIQPAQTARTEIQTAQATPRYSAETIAEAAINETTQLPVIKDATAAPMPLSITYWSPETEGEAIRGWVAGVGLQEVSDMETGEIKMLESFFFMKQNENGQIERVFNASKVLVANIKSAIQRGEIVPGTTLTPVQIKYKGLKKNSRNAFKSKVFEILPLIVSQQ
jgi:hypothetical protein